MCDEKSEKFIYYSLNISIIDLIIIFSMYTHIYQIYKVL